MKKIDLAKAPVRLGSRYPAPYHEPLAGRRVTVLGDVAGLTQFGVVLVDLPPGTWSTQRHWHEREDEFVYVLEGEVVLVTDAGEEIMRAGDSAGFKAAERDGHCLQNRSDKQARLLVVGTRDDEDTGEYSDIDMKFLPHRYTEGNKYVRKNGDPIE